MTPEEKEEEQWQTMHVLLMGPRHRNGLCVERCADNVCDAGCLNQKARHFRPAIMTGIKTLREQGDTRFPLTAAAAVGEYMECPTGTPITPRGRGLRPDSSLCSDPVCMVAGCLNKMAFQYREIIKAAQQADVVKALKK